MTNLAPRESEAIEAPASHGGSLAPLNMGSHGGDGRSLRDGSPPSLAERRTYIEGVPMDPAERKRQRRIAFIHTELERLRVGVEVLPSGAVRMRRGACHLLVAGFEYVTDDDLVMFQGGTARVQQHAAYEARR